MLGKMFSQLTCLVLMPALLLLTLACGSINGEETAQSKAVRDRSRVLGLSLMGDGTYQFRLCPLHKNYTAAILANECINPLVNEDGTARVFNDVPAKPGTALAKFRNWATAALAGAIAGVLIYKIGRFYVKTKARDRIVGKARLKHHQAKIAEKKARNDFEFVTQLGATGVSSVGGKDFSKAIAFADSYGKEVEGKIKEAIDAVVSLKERVIISPDDISSTIRDQLSEARKALQKADSGFDIDENLAQKIMKLEEEGTNEMSKASSEKLDDVLIAFESEARAIYKRVQDKAGLRLQLSDAEKKSLFAIPDTDSVFDAVSKWKHNRVELSLLDNEIQEMEKVFLKFKYGKDELVERLLRIDDVVVVKKENVPDERAISQLKKDIDTYSKAVKESEDRLKNLDNPDEAKAQLNRAKAQLNRAKAQLTERIKTYNPQKGEDIKKYQTKTGEAIKFDPVAEKIEEFKAEEFKAKAKRSGGEGLFADGLGKVGNGIKGNKIVKGGVKFMSGFPWLGEDTLKYSKLNKITVTDEDKVVAKLARGDEVKDVEVQKGAEKLSAQVVGISAFLSLPLTAWSRYLPGHALLSAEKNWTEVTGGHATAKRVDDMLTILDGIAQATDSKVSQEALIFGL